MGWRILSEGRGNSGYGERNGYSERGNHIKHKIKEAFEDFLDEVMEDMDGYGERGGDYNNGYGERDMYDDQMNSGYGERRGRSRTTGRYVRR